jgi:hypothetical protein
MARSKGYTGKLNKPSLGSVDALDVLKEPRNWMPLFEKPGA